MRRLAASFALSFTFSFLLPSSLLLAFTVRSVSEERAQGEVGSIVKLKIWPGYGLNINFIPTGEIIKKAWIDDPSRIALSFDGNLCQWSGNQGQGQGCTNEGATVIHLRQIEPIDFENLPSSPGGGTLLTVVTEGKGQRNLYQFQIVAASGEPKYTSLKIKPDSEKPAPISRNAPLVTTSTSQQDETGSDSSASSEALKQLLTSVSYANDVVTGLMVADNKGQIAHGSKTWRKVQDAIYHLRRGESKEVAASRSGVPLSLLSQLIAWGQKSEVKSQKSEESQKLKVKSQKF